MNPLTAAIMAVTAAILLRRKRRVPLSGLGMPAGDHAHHAGRALILAEEFAEAAHERVVQDDCGGAYAAVLRARSALSIAHAHAASGGLGRAMREVAATDSLVNRAASVVRRACVR